MLDIIKGRRSGPSETIEWDDTVPGLGRRVRFGRDGAEISASWIVRVRVDGRERKATLGAAATMTLDEARAAAPAARARLTGEDGAALPTLPAIATIAELGERYLRDRTPSWKPSTIPAHAHAVRGRIAGGLGMVRVADLDAPMVRVWFDALPVAIGTANRALAVLSGMMDHAELLGLRSSGSNPCAGMRRARSGFKARALSAEDWARLGHALRIEEAIAPEAVDLIRFLALTGCRKSEARLLRFDGVEGPRAILPDSKTGPRTIWLGAPARAIVEARREAVAARAPGTGEPFVFGRGGAPLPIHRLDEVWRRVRVRSGIEDVRLHDLRHGFGAVAAGLGTGLPTIGGLMGHSRLATTAGYARHATDDVRRAAHRVGGRVARTLRSEVPRAAPKPLRAKPTETEQLVARFRRSALGLPAFCAAHELDEAAFRDVVEAIRKDSLKAARKAARREAWA